jgi:succinate dehydrogenase / fumarate reductase flavoprotein subunit
MAIGEAACVSVHGANRLGTNSLTDLIVFGRAAARRCGETVRPSEAHAKSPKGACNAALDRFDRVRHSCGSELPAVIRLEMQRAMQKHCEVYRTGDLLQEGVRRIAGVCRAFKSVRVTDRSLIWNTDLIETLELYNLILQAAVTVSSAFNREESRGAHFREGFPERFESWMKHTVAWVDEEGTSVKIDYRPVHMTPLTGEGRPFPPEKQVR